MKRRSFLMAPAALLFGAECYAHTIHSRKRGEPCVNGSCSMCQHNDAHRKGLRHKNGQWYDPRRTHPSDIRPLCDAVDLYDSTPQAVVDAMLRIVAPTPDDLLCDMGCADGRIVISAARDYGCRAIGVEIKPDRANLARKNVQIAGVSTHVAIVTGDARDISLDYVTIVVFYLFSDLILQILPDTGNARTIVSINHRLPQMRGLTQVSHKLGKSVIYVAVRSQL